MTGSPVQVVRPLVQSSTEAERRHGRIPHVHRGRIPAGRVPRDRGARPRPGPRHRDRRAVGERRQDAQHGGDGCQKGRMGHRAHEPGHDPADRRGPGADRGGDRCGTAGPSRAAEARRRLRPLRPAGPEPVSGSFDMSYTELTVWTRGIIMDKEGRDIVNSVAAAGRLEGKFAQAMENYVDNPDRTNAPTRKYCRLSESAIENELTY